ncbi:hypothetical protein [Pseudobacteroides cellulosolvens]|uniref:DUF2680 domain-containing protein n=1 Tax=Pseudobacteroides cellulosolvens ATCC 35603 = DSM 2933 TaxID=398512 RepID=A0A0L6JPK4_9FIRM|nr:hypothetical protein [Pseudobacteroides cellulosolvens]KNY27307.1 Protein of unknown function DUF2680 [Pseudobacteroides cellulosolvens ATCC 35603 = DSM 2933]
MNNIKKFLAVFTIAGVIGAVGIAYAADIKSPADIASSLTGKSIADVNKERAEGKTYGTIAKDAGKFEEFKAQMIEQRKASLDQMVRDGRITQQRADEIYNTIKANQESCDGMGSAKIGRNSGIGFGKGQGMGCGQGQGMGRGMGRGCAGAGCTIGTSN